MDSDKVDQFLKNSGGSLQTIEYIKFNNPPPEPSTYKKMDKQLFEITDDGWIFQEVAERNRAWDCGNMELWVRRSLHRNHLAMT